MFTTKTHVHQDKTASTTGNQLFASAQWLVECMLLGTWQTTVLRAEQKTLDKKNVFAECHKKKIHDKESFDTSKKKTLGTLASLLSVLLGPQQTRSLPSTREQRLGKDLVCQVLEKQNTDKDKFKAYFETV